MIQSLPVPFLEQLDVFILRHLASRSTRFASSFLVESIESNPIKSNRRRPVASPPPPNPVLFTVRPRRSRVASVVRAPVARASIAVDAFSPDPPASSPRAPSRSRRRRRRRVAHCRRGDGDDAGVVDVVWVNSPRSAVGREGVGAAPMSPREGVGV
jgi:hypothetical protein